MSDRLPYYVYKYEKRNIGLLASSLPLTQKCFVKVDMMDEEEEEATGTEDESWATGFCFSRSVRSEVLVGVGCGAECAAAFLWTQVMKVETLMNTAITIHRNTTTKYYNTHP